MLAGFSGNHERQEASREAEIKELRAKIGELVIDRDFFIQGLRSLSPGRRGEMVDPNHARLSIVRQCRLVSVAPLVVLLRGRQRETGTLARRRGDPAGPRHLIPHDLGDPAQRATDSI